MSGEVACTSLSARWCPVHGDCTCPGDYADLDDMRCPLHSFRSEHGELNVRAVIGDAPDYHELPDDELPGMWERADFMGGPDE